MNNQITIIGSNSILYKNLKTQLFNHNVKELSHKDLNSVKEIVNPIVFSYSKKSLSENLSMMDLISKKTKGKILYISTTAVLACAISDKYLYSTNKKKIENHIIPKDNISIIRIGLVENLFDKTKICGQIKYSSITKIVSCIKDAYEHDTKIINAWETIRIKGSILNNAFLKVEFFLLKIFKSYFFYTRPIDLLFKLMKFNNYGYTFLSNNHQINCQKNTIVGSGMSSLGVLTAINESQSNLDDTILIHDFSSKLNHSVNNKSIEYSGNGGNSNYWHSVISIFLKNKNIELSRSFFFNLFYKKGYDLLKKGYSFIPIKPLRPLKKISKIIDKNKIFDDELIYVEKGVENCDNLVIHTKRNTFYTQNIFLCTGSISSLDLLFKSNLITDDKVVLSEHLVGYFGQIILNRKSNLDRTIFKFNGHFKRFHNILLNPNRSMFVTLRPALFGFKSLEAASSFRDFFGRGSSSIFINLIKKFNLALILEAMYNKFGLKFFNSKRYNIAGHIESKNSVSIQLSTSEKPKIIYGEKNIKLNKDEIDNINKYLNSKYNIESIIISEKTSVSPGLHFLNASNIGMIPIDLNGLSKDHIYPFGTYLFQNHAPTHPTYDLFVDSYLKTKKILC
jgi:hypothetical protein